QNPEQLFVAQVLINKVKSKCCGIKDIYISVHRGKKFRKVNQAEGALGLMEKTKRLGFDKWLDIMNKEKAELENKEQSKK
ncbi:hypothetical protein I6E23_11615, partial [Prevotella brevis]|nr:hypothetical protein [Xylanibacter brevis]